MTDLDLLVVGGGPVGLVTALEARRRGLDVLLLDARDGAGDKACGEGLMPSSLAALQRLGVDPTGAPIRGIRYRDGHGRLAEARFAGTPGRGVRRTVLVAALRDRADAAGVVRRGGRVTALVSEPDRIAVQCRDRDPAPPLAARYVAVADGLHSPLRRSLGLERPRRGPARYGLRRHYRLAPWSDCVEVHWAADAEAYVTPVGPDEVGVAVLCRGGDTFDGWLGRFPELASRLAGVPTTSSIRGAGPLRQAARRRVAGRALLVGDAAGYVDALTGEGMAVGFAGAAALVRCVADDRPDAYEAAWRQVTRRPRAITAGLLAATQVPMARRLLLPAAQSLPWAFTGAVRALA
jgi:flavin-dependent dehydrogenase